MVSMYMYVLLIYEEIILLCSEVIILLFLLILLDLWDCYPNTCESDDFFSFSSKAEALLYLF